MAEAKPREAPARPHAPLVPRAIWLPAAAWAAYVPLGALAASLGAGAYGTALVALLPFGGAGLLLRRARVAATLTLVLGLALLLLLADPLRGLGLKPGTIVGAAAFGALALPLGSGFASYQRHQAEARARPVAVAQVRRAGPALPKAGASAAASSPVAKARPGAVAKPHVAISKVAPPTPGPSKPPPAAGPPPNQR